jgi:hypothetical protein
MVATNDDTITRPISDLQDDLHPFGLSLEEAGTSPLPTPSGTSPVEEIGSLSAIPDQSQISEIADRCTFSLTSCVTITRGPVSARSGVWEYLAELAGKA